MNYLKLLTLMPFLIAPMTLHADQVIPSTIEVLPADKVQWRYLNPDRGDKGPKAADLWGDRTKDVPTGILLQFAEGFSSPPHIHNISYRGVVIEGALHNDDPTAEKIWLPPGSFWTQPAGEVHITAANQKVNIAFIEIDSGPYLVQHQDKAFDNGERPVNVAPSNLVWLHADDIAWIDHVDAEIAFLWGESQAGKSRGTMLKLPANFKGNIEVPASSFKAVVIKGELIHLQWKGKDTLAPGSYFGSTGKISHHLQTISNNETVLYIHSTDKYKVLKE